MMAMLRRLEARRDALVTRSTAQRARLSAQLAPAARTLASAQRFASLLGWAVRIAPIYSLLRRL